MSRTGAARALTLTTVPLLLKLAACGSRPGATECREMLDRYVDMSARRDPAMASTPPAAVDDRVRALLAGKRSEVVYLRAVERCRDDTSASAYACAMAAPGPNEWEACVQ